MSEPKRSNFLPKWAREGRFYMDEFPPIGVPDEPEHPEPNRMFSITLTGTPGFFAILDEMSGKLGVHWGATTLRALALLKTAEDAKAEGKRVAILDDSDNSEQEIIW